MLVESLIKKVNMEPAKIDLTVYKGSTFSKKFQWKTGDPLLPVDISGCTVRMQVRKTATSSSILAEFDQFNGLLVITDPLEGKFQLNIPASISSNFGFTSGVFDIEVAYSDNITVYRLIEGSFTAVPEVTRNG